MPPFPTKKPNDPAVRLPPHPATVVQPKRPFGWAPRPPHPATVAQPRRALGSVVSRPEMHRGPIQRSELKRITDLIPPQRQITPMDALREYIFYLRSMTPSHLSTAVTPSLGSAVEALNATEGTLLSKIQKAREYIDPAVAILESHYKPETISVVPTGGPVFLSFFSDIEGTKLADALIGHVSGNTSASDVIAFVAYDGKTYVQVSKGSSDGYDFAMASCGDSGKCEHSVSKSDGEVLLLSGVLDKLLQDDRADPVVVLCGPFGACHGCKDRVRKLCTLWRARTQNGKTLTVHYIYQNVHRAVRDGLATIYGDDADPRAKLTGKSKEDTLYICSWLG